MLKLFPNIGVITLLVVFALAIPCNAGEDGEDDHGSGYEFIVHVYYEDIYRILVFLFAAYVFGMVTKALSMPALVGEIITGLLLGPPLANFVPFSEALVLIGEIGLIFLLIEAGIELDIVQLRQTGSRAMSIAVVGSVLPILAGFAISMVTDKDLDFKGALAVGFSFAPTSLGVASCALSSGGISNTPVGQLIMAACVLSDIIGLVLLSMFQVLVKADPKVFDFFIPIISSFGFLIILGGAAVMFLSRWIELQFLQTFPKQHRNMAMFGLLFSMTMGYLPLMYYTRASYLAGAFLVGATFSLIDGAHKKFKHSTHSIMEWLLRIFFAASIGFQVPVKLFRETEVVLTGLLFFSTAIVIKILVVVFVPKGGGSDANHDNYKRDLLVTGLSMTCRGELNFIIAAFALNEGVIAPKMYASVVFAVLLSAITSPYLLLKVIQYFKELQKKRLDGTNPKTGGSGDGTGTMPLHLHIHLETKAAWSLMDRIQKQTNSMGLIIEDYRTVYDRGLDPTIVTNIYVRDSNTRINIPNVRSEKNLNCAVNKISLRVPNFQESNSTYLEEFAKCSKSLDEDETRAIEDLVDKAKDDEKIETRKKEILLHLYRACNDVEILSLAAYQWTPWNWNHAFDAISLKLSSGKDVSFSFFMNIFDLADADGSGDVDECELLSVFDDVGMKVTKEGLSSMITAIDEDNDGKISRQEWEDAINLYLGKKEKAFQTGKCSMNLISEMDGANHGHISFPVKPLGNPQADEELE